MTQQTAQNLSELVSTLTCWQEIESAAIAQTTAVMETIRQNSTMHRKVQQVILDNLEKEAFSLTPEELGGVWEMIEKHSSMERETIALAEKARRNCRLFVQRHLLTYLIEDERKHDLLLTQLEDFKRKIYPYSLSTVIIEVVPVPPDSLCNRLRQYAQQ